MKNKKLIYPTCDKLMMSGSHSNSLSGSNFAPYQGRIEDELSLTVWFNSLSIKTFINIHSE